MAIVDTARLGRRDSIAIAQVEPPRGAISPDRVLNKTREYFWKVWIEGAGIDLARDSPDDFGAAAHGITGRAILMGDTAIP